jgi:hypothetical protein
MHSMRKLTILMALAAPLTTYLAPAHAAVSDVASVSGSGMISPGLPTTGCAVQTSVTFSGTATVQGDEAGTYSVTFTGGSGTTCETLSSGAGTGTLSGGVSGNVSYSRNGNIVTLTGNSIQVGSSPAHTITAGVCQFVPTNANPVTKYNLTCQVVLSD